MLVFVAAGLAVLLFGLCLAAKLFRVAVGLLVLSAVIPIMFAVFWGDGRDYVSQFAGIFYPKHQQQIIEAYEFYKGKDAEDPFVNAEAVSDAVTDAFAELSDVGEEAVSMAADKAQELLRQHQSSGVPAESTGP